jgi:cytochrome c5
MKKLRVWTILLSAALALGITFITSLGYASDSITKHQLGGVEYPTYPKVNYGTGTNAELIKRGEYLAKAGDCIACHTDTKNNGPQFAGGLGIDTPFGTFYSPNITPDQKTGIGKWSDADFIRAMRTGIAPDGSYYFPVFPYTSFAKVSDDDLRAIKAYLFSLSPVHKENRKPGVPWPVSWRFLQLGWRILFFHESIYRYDANHSSVWNRGAYLVQGLGHCGECHTPRNIFGAMKKKNFLTGAFIGGYFAPDVTSYGLKDVTHEEIEDVFTHDEMLKGAGVVQGPMAEVNHDSLKYMNMSDLHAIAIYLQTVKSQEPKTSSGPVGAGAGKKIYEAHCAVCHGTGAAGAPKLGDVPDWSSRIKQGMDVLFQHAINGFNSMPPKGTCMSCSDAEVKAAVQYLADQSKPGAASAGIPAAIAAPLKPTLADGKRIYEETCSVCHAQGLLGAPKVGDHAAWAPRIKQNMDVLFTHTIYGYNRMPPRGTCISCTNAELEAAVKYMAQQSSNGDYSLW